MGNNSYIAQEIITELHVHYSIVTYTQNKIHGIWSITNLNRGYIDPTDSRLILCAILAAFKGLLAAKKL